MQFHPLSQPGWGQPEPDPLDARVRQPFSEWQQQPSMYVPTPPQQQTGYPQWQGQPQQPYYPPQQQQWQQPPMMPMQQPQRPPKKKTGRIVGFGCGSLVALVIVIAIIAAAASGNKGTGSPSTDTTTPAAQTTATPAQSTSAPTVQPTTKPTQVPSKLFIGNQVVVGGTEDAFNVKFGNPTSRQTQNGAQELFYDTGDSHIGNFGIVLVPGTHAVFGIAIGAPTGQSWDAITALLCINYMPEDTKLDQPHTVTDTSGTAVGLYQGGHSAELANSLDPANFNDASGNNSVAPGTVSVKYVYSDSSGTSVDVCTLRLGQQ